jgi:hypothetical protein
MHRHFPDCRRNECFDAGNMRRNLHRMKAVWSIYCPRTTHDIRIRSNRRASRSKAFYDSRFKLLGLSANACSKSAPSRWRMLALKVVMPPWLSFGASGSQCFTAFRRLSFVCLVFCSGRICHPSTIDQASFRRPSWHSTQETTDEP